MVGIAFSSAMAIDYFLPSPAFCGFRGGCDEVTHSDFGTWFGVPLPLLGFVSFQSFLILTLFDNDKVKYLITPMAYIAGVVGFALVGVQYFYLQQTCFLCLIVDASAILLLATELGLGADSPDIVESSTQKCSHCSHRNGWICLAIAAAVVPFGWPLLKPAPKIPMEAKASWSKDQINVVEITDFQCKYCRASHSEMKKFLQQNGGSLNFVRFVMPLAHHQNARLAAKAYLSADRQGKGEEMADLLFAGEDHSRDSLDKMALEVGCDIKQFHEDFDSPKIETMIKDTAAWVKDSSGEGLPQIWIQEILLVGEQNVDSLSAALNRVRQRSIQ